MHDSKPTISAFIITKNNADRIQDCLHSLAWADEVVVVDDFSTDATPDICRSFPNAKIHQRSFDGFQQQKEHAMSLCKSDWVLKIDADERVSDAMREAIVNLTAADFSSYSCFEFRRLTWFWDRGIKHASFYPDYNPRLFNRTQGAWGGINPHDKFISRGKTKRLPVDLIHYQNWDINTYASRTILYSMISAEEYHKHGKRVKWHQFTVRPLYTFIYRYFVRLGFLEGVRGLVISFMGALGTFVKYARLYEIQSGKASSEKGGDREKQ